MPSACGPIEPNCYSHYNDVGYLTALACRQAYNCVVPEIIDLTGGRSRKRRRRKRRKKRKTHKKRRRRRTRRRKKRRKRKKLRGGATNQEILEVFDAMIDINRLRYKDAKKNLLTIPITLGVLKRYGHLLHPRITPRRTFAMIQSVNMPLSFDDFARINNGFLDLPQNRQKNDGTYIVDFNNDWNLLFNAILNDPRSRSERGRRGGISHHP
jgi:hypothetical protein